METSDGNKKRLQQAGKSSLGMGHRSKSDSCLISSMPGSYAMQELRRKQKAPPITCVHDSYINNMKEEQRLKRKKNSDMELTREEMMEKKEQELKEEIESMIGKLNNCASASLGLGPEQAKVSFHLKERRGGPNDGVQKMLNKPNSNLANKADERRNMELAKRRRTATTASLVKDRSIEAAKIKSKRGDDDDDGPMDLMAEHSASNDKKDGGFNFDISAVLGHKKKTLTPAEKRLEFMRSLTQDGELSAMQAFAVLDMDQSGVVILPEFCKVFAKLPIPTEFSILPTEIFNYIFEGNVKNKRVFTMEDFVQRCLPELTQLGCDMEATDIYMDSVQPPQKLITLDPVKLGAPKVGQRFSRPSWYYKIRHPLIPVETFKIKCLEEVQLIEKRLRLMRERVHGTGFFAFFANKTKQKEQNEKLDKELIKTTSLRGLAQALMRKENHADDEFSCIEKKIDKAYEANKERDQVKRIDVMEAFKRASVEIDNPQSDFQTLAKLEEKMALAHTARMSRRIKTDKSAKVGMLMSNIRGIDELQSRSLRDRGGTLVYSEEEQSELRMRIWCFSLQMGKYKPSTEFEDPDECMSSQLRSGMIKLHLHPNRPVDHNPDNEVDQSAEVFWRLEDCQTMQCVYKKASQTPAKPLYGQVANIFDVMLRKINDVNELKDDEHYILTAKGEYVRFPLPLKFSKVRESELNLERHHVEVARKLKDMIEAESLLLRKIVQVIKNLRLEPEKWAVILSKETKLRVQESFFSWLSDDAALTYEQLGEMIDAKLKLYDGKLVLVDNKPRRNILSPRSVRFNRKFYEQNELELEGDPLTIYLDQTGQGKGVAGKLAGNLEKIMEVEEKIRYLRSISPKRTPAPTPKRTPLRLELTDGSMTPKNAIMDGSISSSPTRSSPTRSSPTRLASSTPKLEPIPDELKTSLVSDPSQKVRQGQFDQQRHRQGGDLFIFDNRKK